jgi:putative ABC transport system permease protein
MIAVAALTFGQAYVTGILGNMLDTFARTESGHVRIRKDGYTERERFMPLHLHISNLSELLPRLRATRGVVEAVPRIRTLVLVDDAASNQPGLLFGLDLEREQGYLDPQSMVALGRLPRENHGEALVGRSFADKLNVTVGDTLTLLGQTAYRSLGGLRVVITGLAESGLAYLDGRALIVPIDQAQLMTDLQNAATEILVFTEDPEDAGGIAMSLGQTLEEAGTSDLEVRPWREQGPLIRLLDSIRPVFGVILLIMLLMAGLIIVNTMLMTIMERTREFGMLAAMGMRSGDLVKLIIAEGLVIGLIGAVLGGGFGTGVALWVQHVGIDVTAAARTVEIPFASILYPEWRLEYALSSALLGLLASGLASLYPARRAVKVAPAEALRS